MKVADDAATTAGQPAPNASRMYGGKYTTDTKGNLLLLGYGPKDRILNGGTESVTSVIVLFGSFFCGWTIRYMITMNSSSHNILVETYVPMLFGLWIGLLYCKIFTYPYDVSGDAIVYCYNVTKLGVTKELVGSKLSGAGKGYSLLQNQGNELVATTGA
jgi:hypothetical protein